MTPRDDGIGMWAAILIGLLFFAWAAAPWIDAEGTAADRHFEVYKQMRCE